MRAGVALAIAVALAACRDPSPPAASAPTRAPEPAATVVSGPYAADLKAFCDGPNDPVVIRLRGDAGSLTLDASQVVRVTAEVVSPRLATDEGRALFRSLAAESMPPKVKASKLREQAARAGLATCAFADLWDPPSGR